MTVLDRSLVQQRVTQESSDVGQADQPESADGERRPEHRKPAPAAVQIELVDPAELTKEHAAREEESGLQEAVRQNEVRRARESAPVQKRDAAESHADV